MFDFPRSLLEFQRRFPDERACAAYLADARWPDGFRCPACDRDKGWELATKAFTWECRRLRQADLGDRRHGDARLEGAARRLVLGRLPDGHPLQRHLRPASAETTGARFVQDGVAALRQASPRHGGARPPAAERPGGDRRDRNSAAEQGRSARGRPGPQRPRQDARRRRRRGARPSAGPGAAGADRGLLRRQPARFHQRQYRRRRHRENRWLVGLPRRSRHHSPPARRRTDGRARCPALGTSPLRQPQTLGARRLPRPAPQAPAILPRRVRVPLQSPQHPPCRSGPGF